MVRIDGAAVAAKVLVETKQRVDALRQRGIQPNNFMPFLNRHLTTVPRSHNKIPASHIII